MRLTLLVLLSCFSGIAPAVQANSQCKRLGGTCKDSRYSSCSGQYRTGLCPGGYYNRCCLPTVQANSQCARLGGTCKDSRYNSCSGQYRTGLCPGGYYNRCCLPAVSTNSQCVTLGGICKDWRYSSCSGGYRTGLCPGDSNNRCCMPKAASVCPLKTYRTNRIKGHSKTIKVEAGFVAYMNTLNFYASACDVTVMVTSSFRRRGQNVNGAIVPPAARSNHFVGHAIDFNLITRDGWCNSGCLQGRKNSGAACFIKKILSNSQLRWGGEFGTPDPVHVDDGMNLGNKVKWNALYYDLQGRCSSV